MEQHLSTRQLELYAPYPKQIEFHNAGATHRERLFLAGNQLGKTVAGGSEVAMHLTGRYPSWWQGRRFDKPVVGWAAGVTGESTRDNPQRLLMGRPGNWGTGTIPADCIIDQSRAMGVNDLLDTVQVKHVSGGVSSVGFKFYEKGREKWQGETLDFVWYDEEPPQDIYTEGLTRTNATKGMVFITATPLLGMTEVVGYFYPLPNTPDRHVTQMTIEDVLHYSAEDRAKIVAAYPAHEREARAKGIPMLGSGRVFPVTEDSIKVSPFKLPAHWVHIGGLDFGWDHPFGAVHLAWDRDRDIVYVTNAYRAKETPIAIHCATLKRWGENLPWAWPHDGMAVGDRQTGEAMSVLYRNGGLDMLHEMATFEGERGTSVEAGVADMLDRMLTGRLKVFNNLDDWFAEFRTYHRKDGKIVKLIDDLLSATRYGIMMLRHARKLENHWSKPLNQPMKGVV